MDNNTEMVEINICGTRIRANRLGVIERFLKNKGWKVVDNVANSNGYNQIEIHSKKIRRQRLIMHIFNPEFNLEDKTQMIDHINQVIMLIQ